MSRRTIIVGLNQTIMAALSMATIAAFIAGPGLGIADRPGAQRPQRRCRFRCWPVHRASGNRARPRHRGRWRAQSEVAARDAEPTRRFGGSSSRRWEPSQWSALFLSHNQLRWSVFPESDLGRSIATGSTTGARRLSTPSDPSRRGSAISPPRTCSTRSSHSRRVAMVAGGGHDPGRRRDPGRGGRGMPLAPGSWRGSALAVLAVALAGIWAGTVPDLPWLPYWAVVVVLLVVARVIGAGGALLPTAWCLAVIFAVGLWNDSMITLSMTLVATLAVMILGVLIGIWMGRSRRVDSGVRPVLDAAADDAVPGLPDPRAGAVPLGNVPRDRRGRAVRGSCGHQDRGRRSPQRRRPPRSRRPVPSDRAGGR